MFISPFFYLLEPRFGFEPKLFRYDGNVLAVDTSATCWSLLWESNPTYARYKGAFFPEEKAYALHITGRWWCPRGSNPAATVCNTVALNQKARAPYGADFGNRTQGYLLTK